MTQLYQEILEEMFVSMRNMKCPSGYNLFNRELNQHDREVMRTQFYYTQMGIQHTLETAFRELVRPLIDDFKDTGETPSLVAIELFRLRKVPLYIRDDTCLYFIGCSIIELC